MKILCVHQGAELYGSDRSFLRSVEALRSAYPDAELRVLLAADGPLVSALEPYCDSIVIRSLMILRRATPLATIAKTTVLAPYFLVRAWRDLDWADISYINTSVIADFLIAVRSQSSCSAVHIREIPRPRFLTLIRILLGFSKASLIFNSEATESAFGFPAARRSVVVPNGVDPVKGLASPPNVEKFDAARPMRIAMLGRINDWKGQDLLVDAVARLSDQERMAVRVRIVGGIFGRSDAPLQRLLAQIGSAELQETVEVEGFVADPHSVYEWADLVAVPSRLPEPFGLVAIEGMAHGRAILAAAHGGLAEIVEDEVTGWLFRPGEASALTQAIKEALNSPAIVASRGAASLARFTDHFSADKYRSRIARTFAEWFDH